MANVTDPTVVGAALSCLRAVAEARTEVPFTYVYDLGIFDLGRPRAHGRAAWEKLRSDVVEQAGGTYIDLRDLLPGESLVYFNDFVHPSEVGYELLARALCEHLSGPRSGPGGPW